LSSGSEVRRSRSKDPRAPGLRIAEGWRRELGGALSQKRLHEGRDMGGERCRNAASCLEKYSVDVEAALEAARQLGQCTNGIVTADLASTRNCPRRYSPVVVITEALDVDSGKMRWSPRSTERLGSANGEGRDLMGLGPRRVLARARDGEWLVGEWMTR
jgi:hypothetical protein